MVNIIASSMLMREDLSSFLYQGLLWAQTKPGQLSARGIQTAWLCFLLCPSRRQGGPGGLLPHVMGSGSRKPSSLRLLPFLPGIQADLFDSSNRLFITDVAKLSFAFVARKPWAVPDPIVGTLS